MVYIWYNSVSLPRKGDEMIEVRTDEVKWVSFGDILTSVAVDGGKCIDVCDLNDYFSGCDFNTYFINGGNVMVGLDSVLDDVSDYLQNADTVEEQYGTARFQMITNIWRLREFVKEQNLNFWVIFEG